MAKKTAAPSALAKQPNAETLALRIDDIAEEIEERFGYIASVLSSSPPVGIVLKAYHLVNTHMLKVLEDQKKAVREALLGFMQADGTGDYDGYRLKRNTPTSHSLDSERVRLLMAAKGIPLKTVQRETVVVDIDPAKMSYLLEKGAITKAEYESLFPKQSPRLTVEKL